MSHLKIDFRRASSKLISFAKKGITGVDLLATSLILLALTPRLLIKSWTSHEFVWLTSGGFGHTITGPDIARRFLRGRILFIVSAWPGRYNKESASIWDNLDIIFVPLFLYRFSEKHIVVRDNFISFIQFFSFKNIFICTDRYETVDENQALYRLPANYAESFGLKIRSLDWIESSHGMSFNWVLGYFKHTKSKDSQSSLCPRKILEYKRVRDRYFDKNKKLVMLYLRKKSGGKPDNYLRDSSSISEFEPVFSYFISKGIVFLITGDCAKPSGTDVRNSSVLDCDSLGMTKEEFYIFSAITCDYVIGAPGGGIWLPSLVCRKPSLLIDCVPYGFTVPDGFILNKRLRLRIDHSPAYDKESLGSMIFRYYSSEFDILNNTSGQIYEASKLFIESNMEGKDISSYIRPPIGLLESVSNSRAFDLEMISGEPS
jgi:hypothetical protein